MKSRMFIPGKNLICLMCFVFLLLNTAMVSADDAPVEDQDSDSLEDFFSDDETLPDKDDTKNSLPGSKVDPPRDLPEASQEKPYSLHGDVSLAIGYRFDHAPPVQGATDHRGLSNLKGEINLEFGAKVFNTWDFFLSGSAGYNAAFDLHNRIYTDQFLDENEKELELKKIFIRGSLSRNLDIKIGRQIVVWGKSDSIRITDILNPLDLREPGMTDIEDIRLPIFMTRLDYYISNLTLSGFLIHERQSHELPVFGSSYYYSPKPMPDEIDPSPTGWENQEFGLSIGATFPGMDIAFYVAHVFDDFGYITKSYQRDHEKITMVGAGAGIARGNFLFKTEAAFLKNLRLSAYLENGQIRENTEDYSRLDFLAGVEYLGFKNTAISFEASDRWLVDYDDDAQKSGSPEHVVQYALRLSKTFLNDVLELSLLASFYGESANEGGFIRVQTDYDVSDSFAVKMGCIFYDSGDNAMLKKIGENNTLFARITYNF